MTTKYVVAPREPTEEMRDAALRVDPADGDYFRAEYEAMLAAIPDDPNAPVLVSQEYVKAVEDFCVVSWISPPKPDADYDTVRKALHDVACWSAQLETDPATNGGKVLVERSELEALRRDAERYRELSTPEIADFLAAVEREALHQRDRWGVDHDAGKADSDWFWLIGFLAGKALHKPEKMLHHIITAAAACLNWHAARVGAHTAMRPGIAGEGAVMAPKPNHDAALAANGEKVA